MKSFDQIQEAHDRLIPIILREIDLGLDEETRKSVHGACDVLCWILEHDHNTAFTKNLEELAAESLKRGYILKAMP